MECQQVLVKLASYVASCRELLALSQEEVAVIQALSKDGLPPQVE
jgi:hypothetical protein